MRSIAARRMLWGLAIAGAIGSASVLEAQLSIGTWVRTDAQAAGLTMTVEACCNGGRRLVYRVSGQTAVMMTVDSPMDGTEVPTMVAGKPSSQTMAITRVDERHYTAVLKVGGKPYATSRGTISADGKTLTVENEVTAAMPGQNVGKTTETWTRR